MLLDRADLASPGSPNTKPTGRSASIRSTSRFFETQRDRRLSAFGPCARVRRRGSDRGRYFSRYDCQEVLGIETQHSWLHVKRQVAARGRVSIAAMQHMRVLRSAEGVFAFYDGRIDGYRFAEGANWVDDGALSLGTASYAVVADGEAVIYDTHVSVEHARYIREALEEQGVRRFTVVLSHWHLDHVAGTAAFEDCEVIASARTAELLAHFKSAIERGEHEGPPGIDPLILPTRIFEDRLCLAVGRAQLELIHTNIHSDDATVVWLPERRLLLCGDTMEDTITYVDEPQSLDLHLTNLGELWRLAPDRILPNHGDPGVLAAGGYSRDLIRATEQYIRILKRCRSDPGIRSTSLRELIAGPLDAGWIHYYAPYEAVHRANLETVLAAA
jgi:cyclase